FRPFTLLANIHQHKFLAAIEHGLDIIHAHFVNPLLGIFHNLKETRGMLGGHQNFSRAADIALPVSVSLPAVEFQRRVAMKGTVQAREAGASSKVIPMAPPGTA